MDQIFLRHLPVNILEKDVDLHPNDFFEDVVRVQKGLEARGPKKSRNQDNFQPRQISPSKVLPKVKYQKFEEPSRKSDFTGAFVYTNR